VSIRSSAAGLLAFALAFSPTAAPSAGFQGAPVFRIVVHPNILVTHDPAATRDESWIAADPLDPKRLVGGVTTLRNGDNENTRYDTIHVSLDGGNTWSETDLPRLETDVSGDPQVAFAPDGTAYFATLAQRREYTLVYRSKDLLHWESHAETKFVNHERMVGDSTTTTSRGTLYIDSRSNGPA